MPSCFDARRDCTQTRFDFVDASVAMHTVIMMTGRCRARAVRRSRRCAATTRRKVQQIGADCRDDGRASICKRWTFASRETIVRRPRPKQPSVGNAAVRVVILSRGNAVVVV